MWVVLVVSRISSSSALFQQFARERRAKEIAEEAYDDADVPSSQTVPGLRKQPSGFAVNLRYEIQ